MVVRDGRTDTGADHHHPSPPPVSLPDEVKYQMVARRQPSLSNHAVYTALDRLERKGYVSHVMGESTPERGGRARKYFHVEAAGREALRATRRSQAVMWEGVVP